MDRVGPQLIDVAAIQDAHPMHGEIERWASEIANDPELTQAVSAALGRQVEPLSEPGCQRFTAHAEQGVAEHRDDNPYTALLYFATLEPESGGELVFPDNGWRFTPTRGKAVVYPGNLTHYVNPQTRPAYRGMLALAYRDAQPPEAPIQNPETEE